jgi:hypothetical protein
MTFLIVGRETVAGDGEACVDHLKTNEVRA